MIKFFRRIRQRLLSESKFSKYLLYAVGEIVLVVIGILIALFLNNWNTDQKNRDKELDLLVEMRQNLDADLSDCRYNIGFCERLFLGCSAVLKHLEERSPYHDSLRVHYGNLYGSTLLTPNTSAYDHLQGMGFDLIENDSLRRSITKLYSERYPYLSKVESGFYMHLQMVDMGPQLYEKVITDTMWVSGYPVNPEALMDDQKFKGVVRMNILTFEYMIRIYQGFERQILMLMDQIDSELNARAR